MPKYVISSLNRGQKGETRGGYRAAIFGPNCQELLLVEGHISVRKFDSLHESRIVQRTMPLCTAYMYYVVHLWVLVSCVINLEFGAESVIFQKGRSGNKFDNLDSTRSFTLLFPSVWRGYKCSSEIALVGFG